MSGIKVVAAVAVSALALLLTGCEPAREHIVDTVEPMSTASDGVKMAPESEQPAPLAPPTATETATETAAQPNTRTQ
jgi:hypothetical protein